MNKILTFLNILVSYFIFGLSWLIPKKKGTYIFYGWHKDTNREIFADNSKYLFLYLANDKSKTVIWLSNNDKLPKILREKGYKAFSQSSRSGILSALRAEYTIRDSFFQLENWRLSGGSKFIQLWHGKGMKKTGFDSPYSLKRYNRFLNPHLFARCEFMIASSSYTAELVHRSFRVPTDQILVSGLPRHDVLFTSISHSEIDSHAPEIFQERRQAGDRLILYAPTFRPDGSSPLDAIDFVALNAVLTSTHSTFFILLHPKFALKPEINLATFSHIQTLAPGLDIYPTLKEFDLLITDYSSLYIDFLLLDRPVAFFTYDREDYEKQMGLYEDFDELTPGPHAKTFPKLLEVIASSSDTFKQARQEVIQKLFSYQDANASKRVVEKILSLGKIK